MTLKIEQFSEGQTTILRLIGRIQSEHLEGLKALCPADQFPIVLDLDEIALVDVEVIHFLCGAERVGIELRNCPRFIREWIVRERRD